MTLPDCTPEHLTITKSAWIFTKWEKDQYPELAENNHHLLGKLDKINAELSNTVKNTVNYPISTQLIHNDKSFISSQEQYNILTNGGMNEMARRSIIGGSSSVNSHVAIGTGIVSAQVTDTVLGNERARIAIGTSLVENKTERYGSVFDSGDISSNLEVTEGGIFTQANTGVMILRVNITPVTVDAGSLLTVQINISHSNGV